MIVSWYNLHPDVGLTFTYESLYSVKAVLYKEVDQLNLKPQKVGETQPGISLPPTQRIQESNSERKYSTSVFTTLTPVGSSLIYLCPNYFTLFCDSTFILNQISQQSSLYLPLECASNVY